MEEIWKDITGFEGYFQVSTLGRIRSVDRIIQDSRYGDRRLKGRILKCVVDRNGYYSLAVTKCDKRTNLRVHRQVALAFIPNPFNYPAVNHKDENRLNNSVDNLEWCTIKYNCNYGTGIERCAKTKWKPVELVDPATNMVIKKYPSQVAAAAEHGIRNKGISQSCRTGQKYFGMIWRYAK